MNKVYLIEDFTLATCSYNTPVITMNMISSFYMLGYICDLLISENSSNEDTANLLDMNELSYFRNPSMGHSPGVDLLFEKCQTRYMLLVDTDVLFLHDINPLLNEFKQSGAAICGVVQGSRGGLDLYDRICPWFCFFDLKQIKEHGFKFYDSVRFSQHLTEQSGSKIYDTGATILEDIKNANLGVLAISEGDQNYYINHFEGMSWRKDSNNPGLIALANQVEQYYIGVCKGMGLNYVLS